MKRTAIALLVSTAGFLAGCTSGDSGAPASQSDYRAGSDFIVQQELSCLVRRDADTGKLQYVEALNHEFAANVIRRNADDVAQSKPPRNELLELTRGTRIHIVSGWEVTDFEKGAHTELKAVIASGPYEEIPVLLERVSHVIKAPQSSGFPYLLADPDYLKPSAR